MLQANFRNAIRFILDETQYNIMLIPHVNWNEAASDFEVLNTWYREYGYTGRVFLSEEYNAPMAKGLLSECEVVIALRTHATIPAIESGVPTIMTGYKLKTTGIHDDILGESYQLLLPAQNMIDVDCLTDKLKYVLQHSFEIREFLKHRIPEYEKGLMTIVEQISMLQNSIGLL